LITRQTEPGKNKTLSVPAMKVNGKNYETIWLDPDDERVVKIINQQYLPFRFIIDDLHSSEDIFLAIRNMSVRGAPLIGAAGAFGVYLETLHSSNNDEILATASRLKSSRPTAVNLACAIDRVLYQVLSVNSHLDKIEYAKTAVLKFCRDEKECSLQIGKYGLTILQELSTKKNNAVVNVLTHCNAGWLACIDYGTALAPVYQAHDKGIKLHVWVDETRPRNQGARLTAWELLQQGVPHTIITDNCGGHLMQHDMVDVVLVGSDRTTINGDVANKTGTYLKALAAYDNKIPFYAALPSSSIDGKHHDGIIEIPIEQRDPDEIKYVEGDCDGKLKKVLICPGQSPALNYAFDVTPSRLITALITERGICSADKQGILNLFPELITMNNSF